MKKTVLCLGILIVTVAGCSSSGGFNEVTGFEGEYAFESKNHILYTRKTGPDFMLTRHDRGAIIQALDTNKDGELDAIRYEVFDKNNEYKYTVEDQDLNGSLDIRHNFGTPNLKQKDSKLEINYHGCWYKVVKGKSNKPVIVVGKNEIPIIGNNGKYTYNKSFKLQGKIPPCSWKTGVRPYN